MAEHTLNWKPGRWGKGLYYPNHGVLHTWNTDQGTVNVDGREIADGEPSHRPMENAELGKSVPLLIHPEGYVRSHNYPGAHEAVETAASLIGGTPDHARDDYGHGYFTLPEDEWDFPTASVKQAGWEHEPPLHPEEAGPHRLEWTPGSWGKGLHFPSGHIVTWNVNDGNQVGINDGLPSHASMMYDFDKDYNRASCMMINPQGLVRTHGQNSGRYMGQAIKETAEAIGGTPDPTPGYFTIPGTEDWDFTGHTAATEPSTPFIEVDGERYMGDPGGLHAGVAQKHGLDRETVARGQFGLLNKGHATYLSGGRDRMVSEPRLWPDEWRADNEAEWQGQDPWDFPTAATHSENPAPKAAAYLTTDALGETYRVGGSLTFQPWDLTRLERIGGWFHKTQEPSPYAREQMNNRTQVYDAAHQLGVAPNEVYRNYSGQQPPYVTAERFAGDPVKRSPAFTEGDRRSFDDWGITNAWHDEYEQGKRNNYLNDPSSAYFDYENWLEWYMQHHPERADGMNRSAGLAWQNTSSRNMTDLTPAANVTLEPDTLTTSNFGVTPGVPVSTVGPLPSHTDSGAHEAPAAAELARFLSAHTGMEAARESERDLAPVSYSLQLREDESEGWEAVARKHGRVKGTTQGHTPTTTHPKPLTHPIHPGTQAQGSGSSEQRAASTNRPSLQRGLPYETKGESIDCAVDGLQTTYQYSKAKESQGTLDGTGPVAVHEVGEAGNEGWNGRGRPVLYHHPHNLYVGPQDGAHSPLYDAMHAVDENWDPSHVHEGLVTPEGLELFEDNEPDHALTERAAAALGTKPHTPEEPWEFPTASSNRGPKGSRRKAGSNGYFHVAPASARESIQATGLQQKAPTENPAWEGFGVYTGKGLYAWNSLPVAEQYRERLNEHRGEPHDIWEVKAHPGWFDEDPEIYYKDAEREFGPGAQSLIYTGDKPLEHRLVVPAGERTAAGPINPVLNSLIEEYKHQTVNTGYETIPVGDLAQAKVSQGLCDIVAENFAGFLGQHGIDAGYTNSGNFEDEHGHTGPQDFGYQAQPHEDTHHATIVEIGGQRYAVDWTASQFGVTDFPKVHVLTPEWPKRAGLDSFNWGEFDKVNNLSDQYPVPEFVQVGEDDLTPYNDSWNPARGKRWPWVWFPQTNKVHVGPANSVHGNIDPQHEGKSGIFWHDPEHGPRVLQFVRVPPEVMKHIENHFHGQQGEDEDPFGFNFAKTASGPQLVDMSDAWDEGMGEEDGHGTGDHPILWYPKHNLVYKGPYNAYHWDMYDGVPQRIQNAEPNPIAGRYDPLEKNCYFYNVPKEHHQALQGAYDALGATHNGEMIEGNDWDFPTAKVAAWDQDAQQSPFPEGIEPWQPGSLGKGLVSPEGKAYTWQIDEHHGRDGYPSHSEAIGALTGTNMSDSKTFDKALRDGWSFFTINHDGTSDYHMGMPEHQEVMKAHLPQEPHCAGCGVPVQVDSDGMYNCPECRWRGVYGEGQGDESDDWDFSSKVAAGGVTNDLFTCQHCGSHALTEPTKLGNGWVQTCMNCKRTRMVNPDHPLIQTIQSMQPAYPALLNEVAPQRAMNYFGRQSSDIKVIDVPALKPPSWPADDDDEQERPILYVPGHKAVYRGEADQTHWQLVNDHSTLRGMHGDTGRKHPMYVNKEQAFYGRQGPEGAYWFYEPSHPDLPHVSELLGGEGGVDDPWNFPVQSKTGAVQLHENDHEPDEFWKTLPIESQGFIYEPRTDTLHVGAHDEVHHDTMWDRIDSPRWECWPGYVSHNKKGYEVWDDGQMPASEHAKLMSHLTQHMGYTPRPLEEIEAEDPNGFHFPTAKMAKETYPQQARRWESLGGLNGAELIHTFPDGHTINHLRTYGDVGKVGMHLVNCWKDKTYFSDPNRVLNEGNPDAMQYMSLHDPAGLPKVSFYVYNGKVQDGFAARNKRPAPEHIQMLQDFAAKNNLGFEEPDYDHAIYHQSAGTDPGPWKPGGWGKGLALPNGELHTWPVSSQSPNGAVGYHHSEYWRNVLKRPHEEFFDLYNYDLPPEQRMQLLHIDPNGRVRNTGSSDVTHDHIYDGTGLERERYIPEKNRSTWGMGDYTEEDWQFPTAKVAALPPLNIVDHGHHEPSFRGFEGRRPMMYDPTTHTLHVGADDMVHFELAGHATQDPAQGTPRRWYEGWVGPNPERDNGYGDWENEGQPNEIGWYKNVPREVHEQVKQHFNAQDETDPFGFDFEAGISGAASEAPEDPSGSGLIQDPVQNHSEQNHGDNEITLLESAHAGSVAAINMKNESSLSDDL